MLPGTHDFDRNCWKTFLYNYEGTAGSDALLRFVMGGDGAEHTFYGVGKCSCAVIHKLHFGIPRFYKEYIL